jgi:hypothetical protein
MEVATEAQEFVPVTIQVPRHLVLAYQRGGIALLDSLLGASERDEAGEFRPMDSATALAMHQDVWSLPQWGTGDDDDERAQWIYRDVEGTGTQEVITAFLINKSGVTAEHLAQVAGYDSARSIPPALRHLATRCRQVGRRPFWKIDGTADGRRYEITTEARGLFEKAMVKASKEI